MLMMDEKKIDNEVKKTIVKVNSNSVDSESDDEFPHKRNDQIYQYAVRRYHRKCPSEIEGACPDERGWKEYDGHRGSFIETSCFRRRRDFKPKTGPPIGDSEPEYISDGLSEEEQEYMKNIRYCCC